MRAATVPALPRPPRQWTSTRPPERTISTTAAPSADQAASNLASGGEADNGDNLLEIRDQDVATAFAIEGLLLVDHFNFLNRYAKAPGAPKIKKALAVKQEAAAEAGWFLSVSDRWVQPFYDRKDLRYLDRCLFS
jgi:hypothetical protein